ncbi:NlpC/P60 family protein [Salipiger sp. PrR003]|uniref:NlpC/P60 family protein n=1 Tax=Salipiger sp. PrR003 TaxID=2706776 RepID=UPI0013D9B2E2|nr:NlpC/P60 family protein [Salipiger sp. PrR003]NDV53899.1 C40 family peptidase [Salipiger sp. PrR003]
MWTDAWIGLPYAVRGRGPTAFDCLGLFIALHLARRGVVIPDPACTMEDAVRLGTVDRYRAHFQRVDTAIEGDALLFLSSGRPLHIGYALDNSNMLHIDATAGSRIERWRGMNWLGKLEGIYRLV